MVTTQDNFMTCLYIYLWIQTADTFFCDFLSAAQRECPELNASIWYTLHITMLSHSTLKSIFKMSII